MSAAKNHPAQMAEGSSLSRKGEEKALWVIFSRNPVGKMEKSKEWK